MRYNPPIPDVPVMRGQLEGPAAQSEIPAGLAASAHLHRPGDALHAAGGDRSPRSEEQYHAERQCRDGEAGRENHLNHSERFWCNPVENSADREREDCCPQQVQVAAAREPPHLPCAQYARAVGNEVFLANMEGV